MTIDYIRVPIKLLGLRLGQTEMVILSLAISFGEKGLLLSNNKLSEMLFVNRRNVINAINRLRCRKYLVDKDKNKRTRNLVIGKRITELLVVSPATPGSVSRDTTNDIKNEEKVVSPATLGSVSSDTKVVSPATPITKRTKVNLKKRRNSEAFRLASFLFSEIQRRKPDFRKPDLQSWAKHVERMIRLDKRKPDRIESVIRWCQNDNGDGSKWRGWQNNVLSTAKLREKFDRLELAMEEGAIAAAGTAKVVRDANGKTPRERLLAEMAEVTDS